MAYTIKEMYLTLQGEGAHAGRTALFCRFAGCNLWSGREKDRPTATCRFCDTDFVGTDGPNGGRFKTASDLVIRIRELWRETAIDDEPYVVFTGGEPLLQLDDNLVQTCKEFSFTIAIETNGTLKAPPGIDWVCVSPKAKANLVQTHGDELKLVYPQNENKPSDFESYEFTHFFLQPKDGPNVHTNTREAVEYCLRHPKWRLSLQTHKLIGIE